MNEISPRITIDGADVDYLDGAYSQPGNLGAATLTFNLPLTYGGLKKLWNKEVCLYLNKQDSTPLFRGWIKRTNVDFNQVEIFAQDIIGYMLLGGSTEKAKIALTKDDNLDGLSAGAAIAKAVTMAKLDSKLGTTMIGNTTPVVSSVRPPLRVTLSILDIITTRFARQQHPPQFTAGYTLVGLHRSPYSRMDRLGLFKSIGELWTTGVHSIAGSPLDRYGYWPLPIGS